MKTTYKGVTKTVSEKLLEPTKKVINPPTKSNKFGAKSLYYNGIYYFFEDIKPTTNEYRLSNGREFEIQVVYHSYKWYQDAHYITRDFRDFLLSYAY